MLYESEVAARAVPSGFPRRRGFAMKPLAILVVEDDACNREVAEIILESAGHQVACLPDGLTALEFLLDQNNRCDVLMLDLHMPQIDGFEVIRRLRAHAPTAALPILCISATTEARLAVACGADHVLIKPYRRADLLAALSVTLGRSC